MIRLSDIGIGLPKGWVILEGVQKVWERKWREIVRVKADEGRVEAKQKADQEKIAAGLLQLAGGQWVAKTDARVQSLYTDAKGRETTLAQGGTPGAVVAGTRDVVASAVSDGGGLRGAVPKTPNETKQIIQNAIKDRVQARLNERLESMTMQERTNARGLLRLQQQGKLEEYFAALFANNGTATTSLDLQNKAGYSVFYLIDSSAVAGKGHAAMIMGSDSEGWYFFSFGYGSTGLSSNDNMAVDFFPTLREAQIALQRYGYYLRWNVANASAIRSAFTEASRHLMSNYNVFTQNCDDIASSIIRAAGIPLQDKLIPNLTYMNQTDSTNGTNSWRAFVNLSDSLK